MAGMRGQGWKTKERLLMVRTRSKEPGLLCESSLWLLTTVRAKTEFMSEGRTATEHFL